MLSRAEAGKRVHRDSSNGKLSDEIEAISRVLYLDKYPSKTLSSVVGSRSRSSGKAPLPDPKLKNKHDNEEQAQKDKKSIWNWKPLKAFSHKNRRFDCCFTLQVHNIEGLPSSMEGQSLRVHWKRRDGGLVTHPAKVSQGTAEFEESLMHSCLVYGSRSGPHHSVKYESKHFLLYAGISGAPEVDLGKHRVDLSRLLPLTLEELEEDKTSGKWTTSFRLSGQGKGSTLNVSFGYQVLGDNGKIPSINQNPWESLSSKEKSSKLVRGHSQAEGRNGIRRIESLPSTLNRPQSRGTMQVVGSVKDLHEVFPEQKSEFARGVEILSRKLEEDILSHQLDDEPELEVFTGEYVSIKSTLSQPQPQVSDDSKLDGEIEVNEFSVIEHGVELSNNEPAASADVIPKDAVISVLESNVVEIDDILDTIINEDSENIAIIDGTSADNVVVEGESADKDNELYSKDSLMRELESALENVSNLELDALNSPEDQDEAAEVGYAQSSCCRRRSLSFDDATNSVANDFLDMLGIEHTPFGLSSESEPESPRERLLRQFEEDALANGCSLFNFSIGDESSSEFGVDAGTRSIWEDPSENFTGPPIIQFPEEKHQGLRSRGKAKMLENLETEALMREWGLNEDSFHPSSPSSSGAFGSPVHFPSEEPLELPSLAEGLGPYLQTKSGGFLRSMNPSLFKSAKSGGNLIMQASSPVVVPAEMGSGIMEILHHLASVGIEKLSVQANKLMPLENITGKTMQQVAWEASASLEGSYRVQVQEQESEAEGISGSLEYLSRKKGSNSVGEDVGGSEYVSLDDLAPLAMDKIEALSMEGLRIQSGMSHEEAPSNIHTKSIGELSALRGTGADFLGGSLGLEGTGGLQLMDIKDGFDDEDGLMSLSLSLDDWMKLDSGEIGDEDQISERTSRILAAHHANSLDYVRRGSKGERRRGRGRKCGLLGNNFTVALMVQLRDPLRDYEPVGAPMLALIQAERVFVPSKPTIFRKVSEIRRDEDDEGSAAKLAAKEEVKEEGVSKVVLEEAVPRFQITEVHVVGLKTDTEKKGLWGTTNQQQSGSRWLLANGMGKNSKQPFTKPKLGGPKFSGPATTKVQPGDTLWSISTRVLGSGSKWKELSALNKHIRNPNIILPADTTLKLR
ncbi:hypothetical protein MLD38_006932 [Melastoma candidum]|uniref:Uncharacterized protein n=1 Tax=Melastoma candidum TaxID=119954 RepID=A0ACB9RQU2_9MYRT|nr:hypothetical protein MLD38_006932 [Melastoma candidum]